MGCGGRKVRSTTALSVVRRLGTKQRVGGEVGCVVNAGDLMGWIERDRASPPRAAGF